MCVCLIVQLCLTLGHPMDCSPPGSSVYGILQARISCHSLLQGIFPTQGLNPGLLHCRWILYHAGHQGSPYSAYSCYKILAIFPMLYSLSLLLIYFIHIPFNPHPCIFPPPPLFPLITTSLLSISVNISFLLYSLFL